ncbi:hypothetical protein Cgig2_018014 [Carnegiea gigantea]|uniref:R13L1/DRL21-like LRR repeat region domain-containing protein n=1 Tax=Carnegiea gigantea TaxID=171969 RepID=A0A9Q1GQJ2_9CARY|nr:hypothetical protein Cgig2_018014 [Carnegiea gigantea]
MSQGIKEIRKRLDAIASNHNQFGFKLDWTLLYGQGKEKWLSLKEVGLGRVKQVDMKKSFIGHKIRTCLRIADIHRSPYQYRYKSDLCILLANWTCLRASDLSDLDIKNLPNAMGRLIHLRYLDLSYNPDLEVLPDSTTTLHNLETLRLVACRKLRELPKDLSKLTKLRVLDTSYCWGLAPMPRRMGRLRCLQKLPLLVLDARYVLKNGQQGGYLSEHQRLTRITFRFPNSNFDEALLEDLQPHPSLKDLKLEGYCGKRMPYWARKENLAIFLPNLVSFYLQSCHKLQHLAVLGRSPKLEFLRLEDLPDLEYIEDTTMSKHSGVVGAWKSEESFFPSLEELELWGLPKLKGWWGDGSNTNQRHGEDKEDDGMPWHCLHHCLRSLELSELPKLVNLPNGMRYLTALQSLHIEACRELESMPEWMLELTSLKQLIILDYSDGLTERCHNCTREDWPNIQHIPQVRIH